MRFLYVRAEQIRRDEVELDAEQSHRLRRVLRKDLGDSLLIRVLDSGKALNTVISFLGKKRTVLSIESMPAKEEHSASDVLSLNLGVSLLKGRKLEHLFEKITELGAASLTPLLARNCVQRQLKEREVERLIKISQQACQQCGRALPPKLNELEDVQSFVEASIESSGRCIVLHERASRELNLFYEADLDKRAKTTVMIGPEGGFSPVEVDSFGRVGAEILSLPGYILRAETAAIAVTSLFSHLFSSPELHYRDLEG